MLATFIVLTVSKFLSIEEEKDNIAKRKKKRIRWINNMKKKEEEKIDFIAETNVPWMDRRNKR